jgi:hypothetical protein
LVNDAQVKLAWFLFKEITNSFSGHCLLFISHWVCDDRRNAANPRAVNCVRCNVIQMWIFAVSRQSGGLAYVEE